MASVVRSSRTRRQPAKKPCEAALEVLRGDARGVCRLPFLRNKEPRAPTQSTELQCNSAIGALDCREGLLLAYTISQEVASSSRAVPTQSTSRPEVSSDRPIEDGGTYNESTSCFDEDAVTKATEASAPSYMVAIESTSSRRRDSSSVRHNDRSDVDEARQRQRQHFREHREADLVVQREKSSTCSVKAPVTALQWLDDSRLVCGLQDGTVIIIARGLQADDDRGTRPAGDDADNSANVDLDSAGGSVWSVTFSRRLHNGSGSHDDDGDKQAHGVVRIRLFGHGLVGSDDVASGVRGSEATVWILYSDRVVVCVGVEALVSFSRRTLWQREHGATHHGVGEQREPLSRRAFAKLQLEGQDEILDIVACAAPIGLFQTRSDGNAHVILAAGISPALAFYPMGPESRSVDLAKIAWAVATRVTSLTVGAIDGIFGLVGLGLRGRGGRAVAAAKEGATGRKGAGSEEDDDSGDNNPPPLVLRWDGGLQDGHRRVTRLSPDPSGRFAAAADGFGRVMLVDCATQQVLRMWKGVRDAECGWLEVREQWEGRRVASVGSERPTDFSTAPGKAEVTPVIGLYLAILAPLRGRVEIWRMRHGPCVRVVPARSGARLVTARPPPAAPGEARDQASAVPDADILTCCYLVNTPDGREAPVRLLPLSLREKDLAELPSRLSREPTMDDDYHLRKIAAAIGETTPSGPGGVELEDDLDGMHKRPSGEREVQEECLLKLLQKLESAEAISRALSLLDDTAASEASRAPSAIGDPAGAKTWSASFQRRVCDLCKARAEAATSGLDKGSAEQRRRSTQTLGAEPDTAISALRFRVAAHKLYTLLKSVEVQPAGVAGGHEDGDPAFLPPGKRGWKHALLCEEAAGWANMVRDKCSERAVLLNAQLPDFQEFLATASVVLKLGGDARNTGTRARNVKSDTPVSLRFRAHANNRRSSQDAGTAASDPDGRDVSTELSTTTPEHPMDEDVQAAGFAASRKRVIGWLFRPLLSDAFAMVTLAQALSMLEVTGSAQLATLVKDVADWFLVLPVGRAADITVGREAQNCPVLRWLKGLILLAAPSPSSNSPSPGIGRHRKQVVSLDSKIAQLDDAKADPGNDRRGGGLFGEPLKGSGSLLNESMKGSSDQASGSGGEDQDVENDISGSDVEESTEDAEEILRPMYEACAASHHLENASMLSVVVAEALTTCREKLEETSLGQVVLGGDEAWLALARRLRMCLFFDHRLHWDIPVDERDRASVRSFEEGTTSVYSVVAKDQLMSLPDPSFEACAAAERAEVEASARSQREAPEADAIVAVKGATRGGGDAVRQPVPAAPSLTDARMDKYWKSVQRLAARPGGLPSTSSLLWSTFSSRATSQSTFGQRARWKDVARASSEIGRAASSRQPPTTSLFFMRSHAQPIVLACHRARWLVLAWASAATRTASTDAGGVGEADAAVERVSLALDHLSYLRTVKPFLAACVAYWLWEHAGVRSHVSVLARAGREGDQTAGDARTTSKPEARPAREAFLAAAEELLKIDALLLPKGRGDGRRGSPASDASFMSLLTEGAMKRCSWPGAWDRWVEECLREAQVHPPRQSAVATHVTLLRALRVSVVCGVPADEPLRLFENGHSLCAPSSMHSMDINWAPTSHQAEASSRADDVTGGKGDGQDGIDVLSRRKTYIRRALEAIVPRPAQNVYRLARDFGLSEDSVRGWHCLVLLREGHDVEGEEIMSQIASLQDLAADIITILRVRLKRFLTILESSPGTSGAVLASLDADTCQWIRSVKDVHGSSSGRARRGGPSTSQGRQPLASTHGVLLCLARALPQDSRHKLQANALVAMVGTMLRHLSRGGAGSSPL